jgi:hypothetical protein
MNRISVLIIAISAVLSQSAAGDEIRHTTFPTAMTGSWAQTAEQCTAKDGSNILIAPSKYGDARGNCNVRWIVETAGSQGLNYAVHALCTSVSKPAKTEVVNIIIRPQKDGRASMGRSFEDLKTYQRCPTEW